MRGQSQMVQRLLRISVQCVPSVLVRAGMHRHHHLRKLMAGKCFHQLVLRHWLRLFGACDVSV